ncbi:MAG TPA: hypothetical protein VGN37_07470 [Actinocatenispora sp.]
MRRRWWGRSTPTRTGTPSDRRLPSWAALGTAFREAFGGDPDIDRRLALVTSQTTGLIHCRYLLRLEPLASMDADTVTRTVGDTIQRYLTDPL